MENNQINHAIIFFEKMESLLSQKGVETLKEIRRIKYRGGFNEEVVNLIPTKEHPHIEYFNRLFQGWSEQSVQEILSTTNCISVAEGCSHQCTICALDTPKKIKYMAYPTILQLIGELEAKKIPNLESLSSLGAPRLINYFKCDPFDYRFKFSDGSIADYGDVYRGFIERGFALDISTVGWNPEDRICQFAGNKVAQVGTGEPNHFFISYHGYSLEARRDFFVYLNMVRNVVETILRVPGNSLFIRCEDKNDQIPALLATLENSGLLSQNGISKQEAVSFARGDSNIVTSSLKLVRSYKEVYPKDETGRLKLVGPFLGHSIDYNGDVYRRDSPLEFYHKIGNIYRGPNSDH